MQDLVIEWKEDGTHLYEQIYQYIRDEIRRGKLLCQEKLPSTRSLAEYLQVSRSTVELAYDQLVAEGYLEARQRSGFFVFIQQLEDGRNQRFFSSSRRSSRSQTPSIYWMPSARSYLP